MKRKVDHSGIVTQIAMLLLALIWAPSVSANATKSFEISTTTAFLLGEFHGTSISSDGELRVGSPLERTPIEGVEIAKSLTRAKDNSWLMGTGPKGIIYRVNGSRVEQFATTDAVLVTSLVTDSKGNVYAGTSPGGKVLIFDRGGKLLETVALPEANHVWSLAYDKASNRAVAVTGPKGGVFSVTSSGKSEKLFQAKQNNLLSVAVGANGDIYVGSDENAQLYRIDKKGKASVAYDFPGQEIGAIAFDQGKLAVIANELSSSTKPQDESGFRWSPAVPAQNTETPQLQIKGVGQVWTAQEGKSFEQVFINRDSYLTSVVFRQKGKSLLVGSGQDGRIFEVFDDERFKIWADFEERQVLALSDEGEFACVTASLGVLYHAGGKGKGSIDWVSNALDAQNDSSWGAVKWLGDGRAKIETRSGNTDKPGDFWSTWQSLNDQRVASPHARFLQVRVTLDDKDDVLRSLKIFYLPQNTRPVIGNVRVTRRSAGSDNSPWMDIAWDVQNPDNDTTNVRIRYQRLGDSFWIALTKEDALPTGTTFGWNTEALPDANYLVQVEATDETEQPLERKLTSSALSAPVLIDHQPPSFTKLERKSNAISGRVSDELGPIDSIEFSVDGGRWNPVAASDGIYDERTEDFTIEAGKHFKKDAHLVTLRARDSNGNVSAAQGTK